LTAAQARARFGGEGNFLFGDFGAVDVMFAPVVTRFITYSLPVAQFALPYMQSVISHPFMQEWIGGAQAEDWVIEKFEGPLECDLDHGHDGICQRQPQHAKQRPE
jgi:glutathione S-transferase